MYRKYYVFLKENNDITVFENGTNIVPRSNAVWQYIKESLKLKILPLTIFLMFKTNRNGICEEAKLLRSNSKINSSTTVTVENVTKSSLASKVTPLLSPQSLRRHLPLDSCLSHDESNITSEETNINKDQIQENVHTNRNNRLSSPIHSSINSNDLDDEPPHTTEDDDDKSSLSIENNENIENIQPLPSGTTTDLNKTIKPPFTSYSFTIPATFLAKYWTPGAKKFSNETLQSWTIPFNELFKTINNKCVLRFFYHKLKYENSRKIKFTPFLASAQCKMPNCYNYTFIVKDPFKVSCDSTCYVLPTGTYNHDGYATERRQVKGELREAYAAELAHKHPSVLAGELLSKNDREVLKSENRNDAPSIVILQKISSQSKKKHD